MDEFVCEWVGLISLERVMVMPHGVLFNVYNSEGGGDEGVALAESLCFVPNPPGMRAKIVERLPLTEGERRLLAQNKPFHTIAWESV